MSLHDNASLSVSKLYQTNFYRSIIFRIIIILVFIIVRNIPNYLMLVLKIAQYNTNNNYYVRMYIDKKKDFHTHVWKSLIFYPLFTIYILYGIYRKYHILLYIAFKSSF